MIFLIDLLKIFSALVWWTMRKIIEILNKPSYLITTTETLIMLLFVGGCFVVLGLISMIVLAIRNKIIKKIIIKRAKNKDNE